MASAQTLTRDIKGFLSKYIKDPDDNLVVELARSITATGFVVTAATVASIGRSVISGFGKKTQEEVIRDLQNQRYISGITSKQNPKESITYSYDEMRSLIGQFGLNFLNYWVIDIGDNKALTTDDIGYLFTFCNEASIAAPEISTDINPLGPTYNEDVSDIRDGDFSLSFLIDANMTPNKIIYKILNKMKDSKTGRLGYRDDYQFNFMTLLFLNNNNNDIMEYKFENVFIKGVTGLELTSNQKQSNNVGITLGYDRKEIKSYKAKDNTSVGGNDVGNKDQGTYITSKLT